MSSARSATPSRGGTSTWATVEEQRPPFDTLTRRLQEKYEIDPQPDRELIATLRYRALAEAGMVPLVGPIVGHGPAVSAQQPPAHRSRILDTELIAIYW